MRKLPDTESILQHITSNSAEPMTTSQLRVEFGVSQKHKRAFKDVLKSLVAEGVLTQNKSKQYVLKKHKEVKQASEPIAVEQKPATPTRTSKRVREPRRKERVRVEPRRKITVPEPEFTSFADLTHKFARKHSLKAKFPKEVMEEVHAMEQLPELTPDRVDMRDHSVICIDPLGARDHDDALTVIKNPNGSWQLEVHIADVSYYVDEHSALDHEAFNRAYTQYLPWKAYPMLPEELSAGVCSLMENEDRYAFTCVIDIAKTGKVKKFEFVKSMVRVGASVTYEEAWEKREEPGFKDLRELTTLLRNRRKEEGYLAMDMPELEVQLNDEGEPVILRHKTAVESHWWIEECMLLANRCCARFLMKNKLKGIYRLHEAPSPEDVAALYYQNPTLFQGLSLSVGSLARLYTGDTNVQPAIFDLYSQLVNKAGGVQLTLYKILRSMKKARYGSQADGHFALGWIDYAHFTSPIRRYADLWVHRQMSQFLYSKRKGRKGSDPGPVCDYISDVEITIMKVERQGRKMCICWLMKDLVGEEFDGTLTGFEEFGMFVSVPVNYAEGLARYSDVPGDYYLYDADTGKVRGRRSGRVISVGDPVRVRLIRCDLERSELDFEVLAFSS
jgi:ribonuclease R